MGVRGRGDRPKHQTLSQTRGHDRHNSPWYTRWWGVPATSAASHNPASGGVQTDEPGRRGGGGTHADSPRCRCRCRHQVALGRGSSLSPAPRRLDPPAPTSTCPPGAVRSSPPILGLGLVSSHPPWPCSVGGETAHPRHNTSFCTVRTASRRRIFTWAVPSTLYC